MTDYQVRDLLSGRVILEMGADHIPRYKNRELQFWTLAAMPTKRTPHRQRFFTLSVSNVEVAWAAYNPKTGQDTGGALYVRSTRLTREGSDGRLKQSCGAGVRLLGATHTEAVEEEATIVFTSLDQAQALLEDQVVSEALRQRTAHPMSGRQVSLLCRRDHNAAFAEQEQVMAGADAR